MTEQELQILARARSSCLHDLTYEEKVKSLSNKKLKKEKNNCCASIRKLIKQKKRTNTEDYRFNDIVEELLMYDYKLVFIRRELNKRKNEK